MKIEEDQADFPEELSEEDQEHIRAAFHEDVVPKLVKLNARLGTLSCAFAGEDYENWTIEFKSIGDDFEIVSFQYDEEGASLDLDL